MIDRRWVGVAATLTVLVLLAGCQAPQAPPGSEDPDADTLGWENGYWYDDPIPVTNEDGLNESELDALVARTMARVERVRGLEFDRTVPVEIVDRSSPVADAERRGPDQRLLANVSAEAAFLAGEDTDATGALRGIIQNGSGGVYDPATDTIRIVTDRDRPILHGETVLAHELTHALQDQHFGIELAGFETTDGQLAYRSLIEGEATLLESAYRSRCGETWQCLQGPARTPTPEQQALTSLGLYWQLQFSYADGVDFAVHHRGTGGWSALDAVHEAPPTQTSEILHPERYPSDPVPVRIADRSGAGWAPATVGGQPATDSLGEATLATSFVFTAFDAYNSSALVDPLTIINREGMSANRTDPLDYGLPAADGWRGDQLRAYTDGTRTGYVFESVWASPSEAVEFAAGYRRLLAHWGGRSIGDGRWVIPEGPYEDAFHLIVEGDTVTVVNAPTLDSLDGVHGPAG